MWGTAGRRSVCRHRWRFIPTHVGNGRNRRTMRPVPAVHPHACGERVISGWDHQQFAGSSPRMWGTDGFIRSHRHQRRFIPTHVGNGNWFRLIACRKPVHPHACGERGGGRHQQSGGGGSSPRMWGTASKSCWAAAGGTVHPHACGERNLGWGLKQFVNGSSPRMWGTAGSVG